MIHSDILGPVRTATTERYLYAINFIDDYSRAIEIYTMTRKSDALEKFQQFVADIGKPGAIRSDNGGEYIGGAFKNYCRTNGIKQQFAIPHTP